MALNFDPWFKVIRFLYIVLFFSTQIIENIFWLNVFPLKLV